MQKSTKARINELGVLSALLCVLVIFIHISSQGITGLLKSSVSFAALFTLWRASQFVVQGFVFLSAVKISMKYKDKGFDIKSYMAFLKDRVLKIFVPYVLWVMVYYIVFCELGYFRFDFAEYIKYVFLGDLSAQFYFIIIIMQFYILFPLWLWLFKKIKLWAGILISFAITFLFVYYFCDFLYVVSNGHMSDFLYNDRIFTSYFCFFAMGVYTGLYYEKFKGFCLKYKYLIVILFFAVLVFNTKVSYDKFLGTHDYFIYGLLHMLYCSLAIFTMYLICHFFNSYKNRFTALLGVIDKGSYYTYLSHCLIIVLLDFALSLAGIYSVKLIFIINIIVVYPVSIWASHLYVKFKRKMRSIEPEREKTVV